jgi:hypothetical protein
MNSRSSRDQSEILQSDSSDRRRSREFNVCADILRSSFVTVEEKTLVVWQGMEWVVDSNWLWDNWL